MRLRKRSHPFCAVVLALATHACSSSSDSGAAQAGTGGSSAVSRGAQNGIAGGPGNGATVLGASGAGANVSTAGRAAGTAGAGGPAPLAMAGRGGGAGAGGVTSSSAGRGGAGGSGNAGSAGGAGSGSVSAMLVPAQGALIGLYYGDANIAATATKLGRSVPIHLVYYAWTDDWTRGAKTDLDAGRIPLVNWEPANVNFNDIVSGSLDSTIMARATSAKALGKSFFLDFAAEMNGDQAWSGNNAPLYVSAYQHIHDIFVAAGASNVVWAWCPNVTDTNGGNKTTLDYYPGDGYVDWTGVDGYNWGTTGGNGWQSFHDVFAKIYPILATKGKPIIIGEMASAEAGGDKGAWIDAMLPSLRNDYPMIRAVVWFDVNKETDWRISSSPASEAAFIRMVSDPYWNP